MIILQGTIRENSFAKQVTEYLLENFPDAVLSTMYRYQRIPNHYLEGDGFIETIPWNDHNFYVMVISSYYNFPPPVFLNWLFQLSKSEVQRIFNKKKVFLVSVQGGTNLNELPIHNMRQLLQKVWDYNDVESHACIKHAMLNVLPDPRLLQLIRSHSEVQC